MVLVKANFGSNNIVDFEFYLPHAPSKEDWIEFPVDTVKYRTGVPFSERRFYIKTVEWCMNESSSFAVEFSHVKITFWD